MSRDKEEPPSPPSQPVLPACVCVSSVGGSVGGGSRPRLAGWWTDGVKKPTPPSRTLALPTTTWPPPRCLVACETEPMQHRFFTLAHVSSSLPPLSFRGACFPSQPLPPPPSPTRPAPLEPSLIVGTRACACAGCAEESAPSLCPDTLHTRDTSTTPDHPPRPWMDQQTRAVAHHPVCVASPHRVTHPKARLP